MRTTKYLMLFALVLLLLIHTALVVCASNTNVVFLADGGSGDGSTVDSPVGDFKEAVKLLRQSGGTIVICKKYTFKNSTPVLWGFYLLRNKLFFSILRKRQTVY